MTIEKIREMQKQAMLEEGRSCPAIQLLGKVRRLQKRYLRTKSRDTLIVCKQAEKQVDDLLKKMGVEID